MWLTSYYNLAPLIALLLFVGGSGAQNGPEKKGMISDGRLLRRDMIINARTRKLDDEEDKSNPYKKLDSILLMYVEQHIDQSETLPADAVPVYDDVPESMLMNSIGTAVVEVVANDIDYNKLQEMLSGAALEVLACIGRQCSVRINISQLDILVSSPLVKVVKSNMVTSNVGIAESEASKSMYADIAREMFGVDGSGVKVCVISSTFACLQGAATSVEDDIANGDLPPWDRMDILLDSSDPDNSCNDEGRAMMQLIYDIAPGINLAFFSALFGVASFVQGIRDLADAKCDIIVDDIIYFLEEPFQDGLIAQAVDYVVDRGVTYFSAPGNRARQSFEVPFVSSPGTDYLDFNGGVGPVRDYIDIDFGTRGSLIILSWSDSSFSASGVAAKTALGLGFFTLDDELIAVVRNLEGESSTAARYPSGIARVRILKLGGPPPDLVKVIFIRRATTILNNAPTTMLNAGTCYGHANAKGAIAVGAARFDRTPGFGRSPAIAESLTTAGGIPILFNTTGQRLPKEDVRMKPWVVGPTGTCTSFFSSVSNGCYRFFGTSASATNVAAVAALMLQVQKKLTPEDIREILKNTAEDMDAEDTPWFDHGFDYRTGYGFVNAVKAIRQAKSSKYGKGNKKGRKIDKNDKRDQNKNGRNLGGAEEHHVLKKRMRHN